MFSCQPQSYAAPQAVWKLIDLAEVNIVNEPDSAVHR